MNHGLKGKNLAEQHKEVARKFVAQVSRLRGIVGVALLGGAARGFADESSDIDLSVFVTKGFSGIRSGERLWQGHDLDISVVDFDTAKAQRWDMVQRWAYSQSTVLYDASGQVEELIRTKVKVSPEEMRDIACRNIMWLGWYGIYYKEGSWKGYQLFGKRRWDFWIRRGDVGSAHYVLDMCIDILLDILFAYNLCLIPDEKWKLNLAYSLPKAPSNLRERLHQALETREVTPAEFERRFRVVRAIFCDLMEMMEEDGFLPEDIYRYLIQRGVIYGGA